MNNEFHAEIVSFNKLTESSNGWTSEDHKALLAMMDMPEDELEGMSDSEIHEMCLMRLNDYEHHESARFVLAYVFKDDITEGKIDQLSHQMVDNHLWEEHSDPAYHFSLFKAYALLRKAYNGIFPEPTGVKFTVKITATTNEALEIFDPSPYAPVVRLLSSGLGESAILNRLYEEHLRGNSFPDAEKILWVLQKVSSTDSEIVYEVTSSNFWLGGLEEGMSFTATSHADTDQELVDE